LGLGIGWISKNQKANGTILNNFEYVLAEIPKIAKIGHFFEN
jgi:hypothetical protein